MSLCLSSLGMKRGSCRPNSEGRHSGSEPFGPSPYLPEISARRACFYEQPEALQTSCRLMVTDVPTDTHTSPGRLELFAPSHLAVTVGSLGDGPGTQMGPLKPGPGTFCVELGGTPCTRRVRTRAMARGGFGACWEPEPRPLCGSLPPPPRNPPTLRGSQLHPGQTEPRGARRDPAARCRGAPLDAPLGMARVSLSGVCTYLRLRSNLVHAMRFHLFIYFFKW